MGMFDSVRTKCPKCPDGILEWQSKSGDCILKEFSVHQVPMNIAFDINGETTICNECRTVFVIILPFEINTVSMLVMEAVKK